MRTGNRFPQSRVCFRQLAPSSERGISLFAAFGRVCKQTEKKLSNKLICFVCCVTLVPNFRKCNNVGGDLKKEREEEGLNLNTKQVGPQKCYHAIMTVAPHKNLRATSLLQNVNYVRHEQRTGGTAGRPFGTCVGVYHWLVRLYHPVEIFILLRKWIWIDGNRFVLSRLSYLLIRQFNSHTRSNRWNWNPRNYGNLARNYTEF